MFIIISPSKTQDFKRDFSDKIGEANFVTPQNLNETKKLVKILKKFSVKDLEELMKISSKLGELNFQRFQKWNGNFSHRKRKNNIFNYSPAIFAFMGDVYRAFNLENWRKGDYIFAEKSLGILSGFYGLISPLSLIKPYRLEMGTKFSFKINNYEYKNLYQFWSDMLTNQVNEILKREKILINLTSKEYGKVIQEKKIVGKIINIDFKIENKGKLKTIAIFAKRARGMMANWIIKNRIKNENDLKKFSEDGWKFAHQLSSSNNFIFIKN